jgi:predicted ArsR family transcriptional regulator
MGDGRTGEPRANQRLTVAQAADRLGITEGAVRSRIKRGTLPTTKEGGAVFVLLGGGTSQANQTANDGTPTAQPGVVEELRDRLVSLERQLQRREDETERLHQIIARLAQANAEQAHTIRAIEAPASEEATEDAETVDEAPERPESQSDAPGSQTATQPPQGGTLRGWRRRILGW